MKLYRRFSRYIDRNLKYINHNSIYISDFSNISTYRQKLIRYNRTARYCRIKKRLFRVGTTSFFLCK
ncbi:hypothetical protein DJ027_24545 [Bacillus cereus]|nr:hypothetical protein DJ027_24545 [Bacillus cereus]